MGHLNSVWGLLEELSSKKGITEIAINSPSDIFVERKGAFIQLNVQLKKEDFMPFCEEVATQNQKIFNNDHPILDGNLPDGSRINIINEPFSQGCPAITIRKYLKTITSFDKNPDIFGLTPYWVKFLKAVVTARLNVVISGGTGAGKTTLLNLLLNELPSQERLITIEDTLELSIKKPNLVRLEARSAGVNNNVAVTIRDLVKNTLRMRPDRIIIGESRGGELFDLLQAMNTGHEGSMTSIHSNSSGECFSRMETLFMLAGFDIPISVVRRQISTAVDFIIQISRDREGNRIISHISEVTGMEGNTITSQQLAVWEDGLLQKTGMTSKNIKKLHEIGGLDIKFFN